MAEKVGKAKEAALQFFKTANPQFGKNDVDLLAALRES
jgi:hypothetical protein